MRNSEKDGGRWARLEEVEGGTEERKSGDLEVKTLSSSVDVVVVHDVIDEEVREQKGQEKEDTPVRASDISEDTWKEIVQDCLVYVTTDSVGDDSSHLPFPAMLMYLCFLCLLLISLPFSRPSWCWSSSCGDSRDVVRMGIPVWDNALTLSLQLVGFVGVAGSRLAGRLWSVKKGREELEDMLRAREVCLAMLVIFCIIDTVVSLILLKSRTNPLAQIFIPILVVASSNSSSAMVVYFVRTARRAAAIGLVVISFILCWSWLGYLLFIETPQQNVFPNYWSTVLQMLILATTANHPDVYLPAFYDSRWSYLYFLPFVAVMLWCLLLLFTIVVYDGFAMGMAEEQSELAMWKAKHLLMVFNKVTNAEAKSRSELRETVSEGTVHFDVMTKIFHEMRKEVCCCIWMYGMYKLMNGCTHGEMVMWI